MLDWLDAWVLRRPFEGRAAARYVRRHRPAFGDLDDRVLAALAGDLAAARVVLDVGAGDGAFARRLAAQRPEATVLAIEPSRALTSGPRRITTVRAAAEALPVADATVDLAICLTSLRHARDRCGALVELRRVVRPGGAAWVVELDRRADGTRVAHHAAAIASMVSRATFRLVILPTCPAATRFEALARRAGWRISSLHADPEQPFFLMRLA